MIKRAQNLCHQNHFYNNKESLTQFFKTRISKGNITNRCQPISGRNMLVKSEQDWWGDWKGLDLV